MLSNPKSSAICWLAEIDSSMRPLVGGKGANLGQLLKAGFLVPNGFVVTTTTFRQVMEFNNMSSFLNGMHQKLDPVNHTSFEREAQATRDLISGAQIPNDLLSLLQTAFDSLGSPLVAVRSSATMEDSSTASFAGQQDTYLNIQNHEEFIRALLNCWASLYEPRSIAYRFEKGLQELSIEMGVVVQTMINPDISGVVFTLDPITGNTETLTVEAIYGLGEPLVSGEITPDLYIIEKASGKIFQQIVSEQIWMLKANDTGNVAEGKSVQLPVTPSDQGLPKLNQAQISELTQTAISIHNYYGRPQDIEWAICDNVLYILQTRPITTMP